MIQQPSCLLWPDLCPFGLGGYNLQGHGWCLCIPKLSPIYGSNLVNNLLELLALVIGIWLICLDKTALEECILTVGDNTSAISWLYKSGWMPTTLATYTAIQLVAHKLGSLLMTSLTILHPSTSKGNTTLSQISFHMPHPLAPDDPSNHKLTQCFHDTLPSQIPPASASIPFPNRFHLGPCWFCKPLNHL
jgi:hypothetical protein